MNTRKHMLLVINMKTNKKPKLRHYQISASAMSNSSEELKNLNLPFFKRRPKEQFMSTNAYSTLSAFFILVRAPSSRSYLLLVKSNWTEISDLCFLALYTFVLGIRGDPLSTYAKFSEKLICLTPWYAHVRVRSRGLELSVCQKILRTYLMDDP